MKRLRPIFKKLEGLFLEEISSTELRPQADFIDFEIAYYEAMLIDRAWPTNLREALDCVDLVLMYDKNELFEIYWSRIGVLYRLAMKYIRENSSIYDEPVLQKGIFEKNKVESRYDFKRRLLQGYALRKGYVLV